MKSVRKTIAIKVDIIKKSNINDRIRVDMWVVLVIEYNSLDRILSKIWLLFL